ncbi:MAG: 2-phospho-L-lactate transferase [Nitrososphaera sp.]
MITILAGGTGSAKLVRGVAELTDDLTVISNVGDNIWLYGLYVCPDIDTILYALSGIVDKKRGWGIQNDTFNSLDQLSRHGAPIWFSLGDRDLATHVLRTQRIKQGDTLSKITDSMRRSLGISPRIIPATDDQVTTTILTNKGRMHIQEFWVKNRGQPQVRGVAFEGSDSALPNEDALKAIKRSKMVIIAPANPVSSIGPMLAVRGIRQALVEKREKVVAVSPIIGESAVSGPALKYMKALGLENSPYGVAKYFGEAVGNFVIAKSDHGLAAKIRRLGMAVLETDIMMKNTQAEIRLARYLVSRLKGR